VAALALDNVQRREHQRSVLDASSTVVAATSLDETLQAVLLATRRAAPDVSAVTIWRVDRERNAILPGPSFGVRHIEQLRPEQLGNDKVLNRILGADGPIWVEDVRADPRLRGQFIVREAIASVAAFPLTAGGEPVGVLFFNYRAPHRFSRYEQDLFATFAALVAGALRDALYLDMRRREHERLAATIRVAEAVGPTLDLGGTLRNILGTLRELFRDRGAILQLGVLLYDESRRTLSFHPVSREFYGKAGDPLPLLEIYRDRSIASRAARRALEREEAVCEHVPDVSTDDDYLRIDERLRCELCLALMATERDRGGRAQLLGTLVLESDRLHAFNDDDVALIKGIARTIGLAIERARTAERLRLESAVAAATVWVHDSAHDIHSQVGRIRRHVGLLQADATLRAEAQGIVEKIDAAAAELGRAAIDPRSLDAEALPVNSWLAQYLPELLPGSVRLAFWPGEPECEVLAVRLLLKRAVRHLVQNAVDAMAPRGRGPLDDLGAPWARGLLTVRTERSGARVCITFSNDGPPIPEHARDRLFSERVTTKHNRAAGDGGLGLLFVRWAVEAMGGTISLRSAERPVTFEIGLPLAPRSAPREPAYAPATSQETSQ
ncbi:MAG TPA: GAF domain-containing protein, partial [Chloroflexaceae bacterium]|nr:GAF domain-containing protein [Chloroflexaceae bacterium]